MQQRAPILCAKKTQRMKKKKNWWDEEIMFLTFNWQEILKKEIPHIPIEQSEYHKSISESESGKPHNIKFFEKLARGA